MRAWTMTGLALAVAACDGSTSVPRDAAAPPPASAAAPVTAAPSACPPGDELGTLLKPYGRTLPRACATAHAVDGGSSELGFTFGADDAPTDVSAGCAEPSTKQCIEDQVRTW